LGASKNKTQSFAKTLFDEIITTAQNTFL